MRGTCVCVVSESPQPDQMRVRPVHGYIIHVCTVIYAAGITYRRVYVLCALAYARLCFTKTLAPRQIVCFCKRST